MSRRWLPMLVVAGLGLVTLVVVLATPNHRVPAVSNDPSFDYVEAARTLDRVRELLADQPDAGLEELRAEFPLLVAVEGKEPSGVLWAAAALGIGLLGTLVTRSGNRFGDYLVWVAVTAAVFGLARALADFDVQHASIDLPLRQVWLALADIFWIPLGVMLAPLLLVTFPNGRLLGRRWAWVMRVAALAAVLLLSQLAHPARYDGRALGPDLPVSLDLAGLVFTVGLACWSLAFLAAAASVFARVLRASGEERTQLAWVAWGVALAVTAWIVSDVAQAFGGDPTFWGPVAQLGLFVALPAALLVTIFRYRLYDIDLVVHKTVLYVALTITVAAAYAVTLTTVSGLLPPAGPVPSLLAVAAAALAVDPARSRLGAAIDRLVYRRKAKPYEALSALSIRLGGGYGLDDGLAAMARAAADGTGASEVEVWMRSEGGLELVATYPLGLGRRTGPTFEALTRVVAIGDDGFLGITMPRGEVIRPEEARLLDDLAAAATQFARNVRLRERLRGRLGELEQRRGELVEARERLSSVISRTSTELESDLHDGAQARAISLSAAIGLARAAGAPDSAARLLASVDEVETAVARFARGLHPPELRASGVGAALRASIPAGPNTVVVTDGAKRAPPEIEAALFFVAMEAAQNALKHAPGSNLAIRHSIEAGTAVLTVVDDGPGFDPTRQPRGRGLASMRERVEALGGELRVDSLRGAGTTVTVALTGAGAP